MASRYIARKYGDHSQARSRTSSVTRESSSRASSQVTLIMQWMDYKLWLQVRDNLSYYSRSSEAKSRSSTPSEWSSGSSYNPSYSSNQDYYRGKVKSIYERDPLFSDFMDSLPPERTRNLYNAGNLTNLKEQFQYMVQDRWGRKQLEDPSVRHDTALQVKKTFFNSPTNSCTPCRHMDGQTILAEATRQPAKSLEENIHGQSWRKQRSTYPTSQFITSRTLAFCNLMNSYCLLQQKSYWKS